MFHSYEFLFPVKFCLCVCMFAQDLEATCSQAEAVAKIKVMKHSMTPTLPQLCHRKLAGNILDQSLGLFNNEKNMSTMSTDMLNQTESSHKAEKEGNLSEITACEVCGGMAFIVFGCVLVCISSYSRAITSLVLLK